MSQISKIKIRDGRVKKYLDSIKTSIKRKKFAVFDIESKEDDTQKMGTQRPFLVGFYDPNFKESKEHGGYLEFRNEPYLNKDPEWRTRHIRLGGCIDKLMNVILSNIFANYIFYSHNGGNFDMLFLLAWLCEHRDQFDFEVVPIQSTIQVLRVWEIPENPDDPIKNHWQFLDSMRLLPMGLKRACETFGISEDKSKISFDLSTHEDDPKWSIYLKQDCIALVEVLNKLYDLIQNKLGGEVGVTTPSTAIKLFRRRFIGNDGVPKYIQRYQHWIECSDNECLGCAHEWIRRGYYGGRTEIFRLRGTKLHYYDINSSYVAAMRQDMPIGDRIIEKGFLDWRKHRSPENTNGKYSGFCECLVYIPESCPIPPLPHRDRKTAKLVFPVGYFYGVWSVEELNLLKDPLVNGKIVSVTKTIWMKLQPMFGKMVEELWKLRDKNLEENYFYDDETGEKIFNKGLSELAKLLGNSTYGKFAMNQERTSVVFAQEVKENQCFLCLARIEQKSGICLGCEGSKPAMPDPDSEVWYRAQKVDAPYIIPHVAAHITALARKRLWEFMKLVISLGGDLYYLDTDSIITNIFLPTSTELGALKDEYPGEELNYLAVQPKVYMIEKMKYNKEVKRNQELLNSEFYDASTLDNEPIKLDYKVTMKGFPPYKRTYDNLVRLQKNETLQWEQLEKVRTLARGGFKNPPKIKEVTKAFKSKYDKRILNDEEGTTIAIYLDERKMILQELVDIHGYEHTTKVAKDWEVEDFISHAAE